MSDTLSQSEIDRLLGGAPSASAPTTPVRAGAAADQAVPYDFRHPHRISKERLRTLESIYERLVKSLEAWTIGRVREQVEMRLQSVEQFAFGEFMQSLSSPCASFILGIADSGHQSGIIDVGLEFAYYLVDRLFGGNGQQSYADRPLTRVERMAVRSVVERATALLKEVWSDHIQMDLEISSFESVPEILIQTGNREDLILVANVEISVGEVRSLMLICLPFSVLDKFFTHTGRRRANTVTGSEQERAVSREIAEQSLRITRVDVAARLPEFRMTMRDIAALAPGGVIQTSLPHNSPVRIRLGSQERFMGTVGRVGNNLAVRITDSIDTETGAPATQSTASLQFTPSFPADQHNG